MAEQSREPEILKSIIDDTEYNKTPQSRNEEILLSILNDTEYTKTPQSREEELLLELKGKIGHGITVEPLSVTENGTYTAPAGTAYSPVEVAVPITPPTPAVKKDVNFYDYDGTVVASYTKQEFLALTEMPANPTHERLTAQGWNYSLADAKSYVTKYGVLNVGQMYTTASGALEIDIELHEGRLHPYLGLNINGLVTVDWGDGTATDNMTGSSLSTVVWKDHVYSAPGAYTIKVFADEGTSVAIVGGGSGSNILTHSSSPSSTSPSMSYNSSVVRIYIADFVMSIGTYAFYNCHAITSITIPDSVTSIGRNAFASCNSITLVTIPDSITGIGNGIFNNCYSLTSITIPDSVTSIGDGAFSSCNSLTKITIPDSVTSIGDSAFSSCNSLTKITIPDSVTSIGGYAFQYCYSLTSILISDSVTSISVRVFSNCQSLTSITIPDDVMYINSNAFSGCDSLASITIPSSVTSIGGNAFNSCSSLGFIKFEPQTPPTVQNSSAWLNAPTDCIIYVPTGTIEAYKATANMPNPSTYTYIEY